MIWAASNKNLIHLFVFIFRFRFLFIGNQCNFFSKVTHALAGIDCEENSGDGQQVQEEEEREADDVAEDKDLEEALILRLVEEKPPVQFGLNGKYLDLIYSGHKPTDYGSALRKWIWGIDGLSYELILPSKSLTDGRRCATKDSMLKFFREFLYYFSQSVETWLILRFDFFSALKVVLCVKICLNMSSSFPMPKKKQKKQQTRLD